MTSNLLKILERHNTMSANRSTVNAGLARRSTFVALVVVVASMLTSCANKDGMSTGSIPDDYRTRHPITLTEVEHTMDIPVASGDRSMTIGMKDAIAGFAQDYQASSSGTVQIIVPHGSMNAGAASRIGKEIRTVLNTKGISSSRIAQSAYQANSRGDAAPIRLSYVATTAITNQCGEWPEDISNNTMENKNWANFGCATQNNLAAQIASPMDLVAPRGMTPIDAARRSTVIGLYREGSSTASN
ncbi:MAG: CpaD family pilus assembly protein [Allorhizobium sp.]